MAIQRGPTLTQPQTLVGYVNPDGSGRGNWIRTVECSTVCSCHGTFPDDEQFCSRCGYAFAAHSEGRCPPSELAARHAWGDR